MSHLSTHILDTSRGKPAASVTVILEHRGDNGWAEHCRGVTDAEGRIKSLPPSGVDLPGGEYRLRFQTGDYFRTAGDPVFYPEVVVHAVLDRASKYHLPLLLAPFGYSTYRGS